MNVELVAQMFKNYQSNVLFHLEGTVLEAMSRQWKYSETDNMQSNRQLEGTNMTALTILSCNGREHFIYST
jgi:hypothetical protein